MPGRYLLLAATTVRGAAAMATSVRSQLSHRSGFSRASSRFVVTSSSRLLLKGSHTSHRAAGCEQTCIACAWHVHVHGVRMACAKRVQRCMACAWHVHGICMACAWHVQGMCKACARHVHGAGLRADHAVDVSEQR